MQTDAELLHRYARQKDGHAFAELVRRHLGMVYATALRSTGGRAHLAEDISQKVFTVLARKAGTLSHRSVLTGWLYRSARYAALETSRSELRRQKLNHTFAAMPDTSAPQNPPMDWEQLRPVIDGALEELKQRDRELMLLRFFQGLSYSEIGAKLGLSENAARMRTERALETLRGYLNRRGITSTAALAGLLGGQSLVAAPISLVASVNAAASAIPTAGVVASFFTGLFYGKTTTVVLSVVVAAGISTLAWVVWANHVSDSQLAALRTENSRLRRVSAVNAQGNAPSATTGDGAARATVIVDAVAKRLAERSAASPGGHRNRGQATPYDAFLTYCWAIDSGDSETLSRILTFTEKGQRDIRVLHAGMPAEVRGRFPTPEGLVVFLFIADTILRPIFNADVAEKFVVIDPSGGRAVLRDPSLQKGGMECIQRTEGWKVIVGDGYPAYIAKRTLGNEMLGKLGIH